MRYAFVAASLVAAVAAAPGWGPPASYGSSGWGVEGTSTIDVTTIDTITSCGPEVTNCPANSVTTVPVTSAITTTAPAVPTGYTTSAVETSPVETSPVETSPVAPASTSYISVESSPVAPTVYSSETTVSLDLSSPRMLSWPLQSQASHGSASRRRNGQSPSNLYSSCFSGRCF